MRGYHEVTPLRADELAVLFELMVVRLRMSVAMAERQFAAAPDNEYLLISQRGVKETLERLEHEDPQLAHFRFRDACGYEASPNARRVRQWLALHDAAPVMDGDWASAPVLDLGGGMPPVEGLAIGRYDEQRSIYIAPEFQTPDGRWRTRHMAVDLFAPAGTPVYAPFDGVVERRENRANAGDYGGLLVLRHEGPFWTLHGHLDPETLADGDGAGRRGDRAARLARGQRRLGAAHPSPGVHGPGRQPRRRRAARGGRPVPQRLPRSRTCCSASRAASTRAPRGRTSPSAAGP